MLNIYHALEMKATINKPARFRRFVLQIFPVDAPKYLYWLESFPQQTSLRWFLEPLKRLNSGTVCPETAN